MPEYPKQQKTQHLCCPNPYRIRIIKYPTFWSSQFQQTQNLCRTINVKKIKPAQIPPQQRKQFQFYRFIQNQQRKLFLMLSLIERFTDIYHQKLRVQQQNIIKKRQDRKKALHLTNNSQFKTIEPISIEHMNLQQTYLFMKKIKDGLIEMFHHNFITQNHKRKSKLIRMLSKNQLMQYNQQNQQEKQNVQHQKNPAEPFITNLFNSTSLSCKSPDVDLMGISSFPINVNELLQNPSNRVGKFQALKKSQSHLRIRPAINKYQSRKKQEIRLFLQFNQKTEHLQNFRSDEGKFFKLNENIKIMVKSVNLCRLVLINKKSAIVQQLQRIQQEQSKQNNSQIPDNISKDQLVANIKRVSQNLNIDSQNIFASIFGSKSQTATIEVPQQIFQFPPALKQKALRIKNYFQQTTSLFNQIQAFLLQFIKHDKSYQNYITQNKLKNKLKNYYLKNKSTSSSFTPKKQSPVQQKYQTFIDKCFHIAQIIRIYFNVLNQIAHQNINLKETFKVIHKWELQRQNKVLIQLRYVLMYLQKQCQNTTQSTFFRKTQNRGIANLEVGKINQFLTQQLSPRLSTDPKQNISFSTAANSQKVHNMTVIELRKSISQQHRKSKQTLTTPLNSILLKSLSQLIQTIPKKNTDISNLRNNKKCKDAKNVKKQEGQKQVDVNQLWRTFYNKKYSNNAMRLRLY